MTDAGRALCADAVTALNDTVFRDLGLEPEELSGLVRTLARFRERSGDFVTPAPRPDPL